VTNLAATLALREGAALAERLGETESRVLALGLLGLGVG
jgi:hypothetical protein